MTKRRRRLVIALGAALVAALALVTSARALLPWAVRAAVERLGSRALGRALRVAGPVEVAISLSPRVTLHDLTLANAPWGSEPAMVRVGRAAVTVELPSLWSGPVRLGGVEVDGARVLLEADAGGVGNWVLPFPPSTRPPAPTPAPPQVVVAGAVLRGLALVYRARPGAPPVEAGVAELTARLDPATRAIALHGRGRLAALPWELSGTVGAYEALLRGEEVSHALTARLGGSTLASRGRLRGSLATSELDLSAEGPDLAAALAILGVTTAPGAPFHLRARLAPAGGGVSGELDATLGGVTAKVQGTLGAQPGEGPLQLSADVAGPDASVVGAWLGVKGLPARPFAVSGRVRREGGLLQLEAARAVLGPTSLTVDGALGAPPRFEGAELSVRASGRDLAALSPLARVRLPSGAFALAGRLRRAPGGLVLRGVELQTQGAALRVEGLLGEPPALARLDLTVAAEGPDLGAFSALAGRALPRLPFAASGRVARDRGGLKLDGVEARLGKVTLEGRGRVALARRLEGTELALRAAGPDLSAVAALAGLRGPAQPFQVSGRVRVVRGAYALEAVEATVGRVSATAEGRVGAAGLPGTSLRCRVRGPSLADLAAWGLPRSLPPDLFSAAGVLRVDEAGGLRLEGVVADAGPDRVTLDGALGALPDTTGLDLAVEAAGPSVARLGRWAAVLGLGAPPHLPDVPYAASGRVRRAAAGLELEAVRATAAATVVRIDGVVGTGEGLAGTDLRFTAEAPDASLLAALAGRTFPGGPLAAHGRLARTGAGLQVDPVAVAVGELRAEATGTLGPWPALTGTALRVSAAGPDVAAALVPVLPGVHLRAAPFTVAAEVSGSRQRLEVRALEVRAGASDLAGALTVRLEGRPAVDAELRSNHLDLQALLADPDADRLGGVAAPGDRPGGRERLIPDRPLVLALPDVDVRLALRVQELKVSDLALRAVAVAGELRRGGLRVERVEATSSDLGRLAGSLEVTPAGRGYRLRAEGRLEGLKLATSRAGTTAADAPALRSEFKLKGEGDSVRALAASLDGEVHVLVDPGRIANTYGKMTTGVVPGLLDALNPFRKSSKETRFECGIALVTVQRGAAVLAPIAARTDQVTIVGKGRVDLATEALELEWTLKPRTGGGISVGSIANPYVKLGGTLAAPKLEVKPVQAVASTGAAVATLGLTVLARGVYDRITAEKNVCVNDLVKDFDAAPAPGEGH